MTQSSFDEDIEDSEKVRRLLALSLPSGWTVGHCAGCGKPFPVVRYTLAGRTGFPCCVGCNDLLNRYFRSA